MRTFGFASYLSPQYVCATQHPTMTFFFFCAAQSLPSNPTHVLKNKDKRGGWLIANNPIFWSSKAVVGLSDNFGWSITINTNKIKCVGGRVEGWGAWPSVPLNRPCDQFPLSISVLSTCPFSWEGGGSLPLASLWSDYPFISSLSEEYLGGQWQIKAHMERSVNVCLLAQREKKMREKKGMMEK